MKGFKEFLMRGNVIDLAIAVVMGAAFGSVVSAFVRDLLTPLIAAIGGTPDFSALSFTVNNSKFSYGDFINTVISFLLVSAVVYYLVIVPSRTLSGQSKPKEVTVRKCPECYYEIPMQARRCAFCTSQIAPITPLKAKAGF